MFLLNGGEHSRSPNYTWFSFVSWWEWFFLIFFHLITSMNTFCLSGRFFQVLLCSQVAFISIYGFCAILMTQLSTVMLFLKGSDSDQSSALVSLEGEIWHFHSLPSMWHHTSVKTAGQTTAAPLKACGEAHDIPDTETIKNSKDSVN